MNTKTKVVQKCLPGLLMNRPTFFKMASMPQKVLKCLRHMSVLYQNCCRDQADFPACWFPSTNATCVLGKLRYVQKPVYFRLELRPKLWTWKILPRYTDCWWVRCLQYLWRRRTNGRRACGTCGMAQTLLVDSISCGFVCRGEARRPLSRT